MHCSSLWGIPNQKFRWLSGFLLCLLTVGLATPAEAKTYPAWEEVTKDAKQLPGLFPLYYNEKDQQLFMEINRGQFDQEFILPMSIARGAGMMYLGGDTLNFGDQWLISFRRSADRVLLVRRNIRFKAAEGSPQADAVQTSYTDSIIKALPVRSEKNGGQSVLIDLADMFMFDLAGIGINPDRSRSTWFKVKAFPENVEVEVSAVFSSSMGYSALYGGDGAVPDPRGTQVVIHYGLSKLPQTGYKPRVADDRMGHFLTTLNDFSTDVDKSPKIRYINRWQLEKEDAAAEKSVPKKPIIFWVEKTVPRKYRPYVREGILEWNKAFEKIGFVDAIQCRDQQAGDDFDPEDIRYNTFRWIATSAGFAMGPSRTNPKTGQILDADIIFDESMVRHYRQNYVRTVGIPQGLELLAQGDRSTFLKYFASEVPEIEAHERELKYLHEQHSKLQNAEPGQPQWHQYPMQPGWVNTARGCNCCMMGPGIQQQLGLISAVLAIHGAEPGGKVPEEYIGQAIKEVVMHEVGHTLGLRHNFKASTMLSLEEINKPEITRKKGMVGSIMDYVPANLSLDPEKQGDYFPTTIGPYDYWVIEYAYKPISGDEKGELAKIAKRASEDELTYATDEDLRGNPDPRINLFDLGDPLEYAEQRIQLMKKSIDGLSKRVVNEGEGYQRARDTFTLLLGEISRAANLTSQYIGGAYTARDHKGDPNERPAIQPIPLEKQEKALEILTREVFSDKAFQFPPELLRELAPEHVTDNYRFAGTYHYPVYDRILSIQGMALSSLLSSSTLSTVLEIELQAKPDEKVLTLPLIFEALTNSIWEELPAEAAEPVDLKISTIRRNLQRAHVQQLTGIVLGPASSGIVSGARNPYAADARSLARLHLLEISGKIKTATELEHVKPDTYTKAHLSELQHQLSKVLDADLQSSRP